MSAAMVRKAVLMVLGFLVLLSIVALRLQRWYVEQLDLVERMPPILDKARSCTGYIVSASGGGREWLRFRIPPGQDSLKLVSNANVPGSLKRVPGFTATYTLDYRISDSDGAILRENTYTVGAEFLFYLDEVTGAPIPGYFYNARSDVPLSSRTIRLPLDGLPRAPAHLEVRLARADHPVSDVTVRAYFNDQPPAFKLRYLWQRMSARKQERLSRAGIYPVNLITEEEKRNLLQNRWAALAPQGIEGRDYREVKLFVLELEETARKRDTSLPAGVYVDAERPAAIAIPEGGGCIRLELERIGDVEPAEDAAVLLAWIGERPGVRSSLELPLRGLITTHFGDFEGGYLEIVSERAIAARAAILAAPEEFDITPDRGLIPSYLLESRDALDFVLGVRRAGHTPLRVDVRWIRSADDPPRQSIVPISVGNPSARGRAKARQARSADAGDTTESIVEEARRRMPGLQPAEARRTYRNRHISLLWCQLLGGDGKVLDEGLIRHQSGESLYDSAAGGFAGQTISDPTRRYLWLPIECKAMRLRSEDDRLLVTVYTRPDSLPRNVKVPEDYLAFEKGENGYRNWFLIRPVNYADCLRRGREVLLRVPDRPPKYSEELLAGDFELAAEVPVGRVQGRRVLARAGESPRASREFSAGRFARLELGGEKAIILAGLPGESSITPRLIFIRDSSAPAALELTAGGSPYFRGLLASRSGAIDLPALPAGRHRIAADGLPGLEIFINSIDPAQEAPWVEKTVFRLDRNGLRYQIRKQTEQRETLVFRQLREPDSSGMRGRSRIEVDVFGPERIERAPHDSWTYRRNVYDLRSAPAPRFPVIWTDGERLEEGETFYLSLGVDQGPGDYEIVLGLEAGPPCYLQLLRIAPGKKDARRVFREERTAAGENGR